MSIVKFVTRQNLSEINKFHIFIFLFSDRTGSNGVAMTASSQYPYNNQQHGRPIQPIRPQQHQTYLPQYNNNIPQLPPQSTNGGMGYNLNDTPVFQRPQPGPQQPSSSIQVIDIEVSRIIRKSNLQLSLYFKIRIISFECKTVLLQNVLHNFPYLYKTTT